MELSKKTTLLLSPELHRRLTRLAAQRGVSMGQLVREACEREYGVGPVEDRIRAVRELARMALPVDTPEAMERESVSDPDALLP
jgi:predicted DNA-binding protein